LWGKKIGDLGAKTAGIHFLFVARPYQEQDIIRFIFPDESDITIAEGDYLLFAGDTRRIASFVESVH
jgi:uncharacterized protein with PhoU and TrkA domain